MTAGALVLTVADDTTEVALIGTGTWTLPVGAASLVENELEHADRPAPEQLTNALGIVADHFDDVVRDESMVASAAPVVAIGTHAEALARVELGRDDVPDDYVLRRADADEVFRTLVAEPIAERMHNPGLRPDEAESIVGACCVVLAVMRRLELETIEIRPPGGWSIEVNG